MSMFVKRHLVGDPHNPPPAAMFYVVRIRDDVTIRKPCFVTDMRSLYSNILLVHGLDRYNILRRTNASGKALAVLFVHTKSNRQTMSVAPTPRSAPITVAQVTESFGSIFQENPSLVDKVRSCVPCTCRRTAGARPVIPPDSQTTAVSHSNILEGKKWR